MKNVTLPQVLLVICTLAIVAAAQYFVPGIVGTLVSLVAPILTWLVYSPKETPLGAPKKPGTKPSVPPLPALFLLAVVFAASETMCGCAFFQKPAVQSLEQQLIMCALPMVESGASAEAIGLKCGLQVLPLLPGLFESHRAAMKSGLARDAGSEQ